MHQLVVVCRVLPAEREVLDRKLEALGIADRVVFTGFVSDESLVAALSGDRSVRLSLAVRGLRPPGCRGDGVRSPRGGFEDRSTHRIDRRACRPVRPERLRGRSRRSSRVVSPTTTFSADSGKRSCPLRRPGAPLPIERLRPMRRWRPGAAARAAASIGHASPSSRPLPPQRSGVADDSYRADQRSLEPRRGRRIRGRRAPGG